MTKQEHIEFLKDKISSLEFEIEDLKDEQNDYKEELKKVDNE